MYFKLNRINLMTFSCWTPARFHRHDHRTQAEVKQIFADETRSAVSFSVFCVAQLFIQTFVCVSSFFPCSFIFAIRNAGVLYRYVNFSQIYIIKKVLQLFMFFFTLYAFSYYQLQTSAESTDYWIRWLLNEKLHETFLFVVVQYLKFP